MVDGAQANKFLNDLKTILNTWSTTDFGSKPDIDIVQDVKVHGYGQAKDENVLIYVDSEKMETYLGGLEWNSWLSATIEIGTNLDRTRFDKMVNSVVSLLKTNVKYTGYAYILIKGYTDLSKDMRGAFRGIVDVQALKHEPAFP